MSFQITSALYIDRIIAGEAPKRAGRPDLSQVDQNRLIDDLIEIFTDLKLNRQALTNNLNTDYLVNRLSKYLGRGSSNRRLERFVRSYLIPYARENIDYIFVKQQPS